MEPAEIIKTIFWNEQIIFGSFLGVFALVIISGIAMAAFPAKGFKYIVFPVFYIYVLFVGYRTITDIGASKQALYDAVNFKNSLEKWKSKQPKEVQFYQQLKLLYRQNNCLVCGKPAEYGVVTYHKGTDPKSLSPSKLLVCESHTDFLSHYVDSKKDVEVFFKKEYSAANFPAPTGIMDASMVDELDNDILFNILNSTITNENIEIEDFMEGIPKSKEKILSGLGFYIGLLLGYGLFMLFVDRD